MKVKIEMIVEVSRESAEDWEIESHLKDALTEYTGNDLEFEDCNIEKCRPALKEFPKDAESVLCIQNFTGTHTNNINGKKETATFSFIKGASYPVHSWRPEGVQLRDFFVFHKDAKNFVRIR